MGNVDNQTIDLGGVSTGLALEMKARWYGLNRDRVLLPGASAPGTQLPGWTKVQSAFGSELWTDVVRNDSPLARHGDLRPSIGVGLPSNRNPDIPPHTRCSRRRTRTKDAADKDHQSYGGNDGSAPHVAGPTTRTSPVAPCKI